MYASHLRFDGDKLRDGLEEAIAIGERAHIPVHVFHLKVTGRNNFGRMKEAIAIIEGARSRGIEMTADQYPYVASSTGLSQTIPPWAHEGGGARLAERLTDPDDAREDSPGDGRPASVLGEPLHLRRHVAQRAARVDFAGGSTRNTRGCESTTRRRQAGQDPYDFVFDLLIA